MCHCVNVLARPLFLCHCANVLARPPFFVVCHTLSGNIYMFVYFTTVLRHHSMCVHVCSVGPVRQLHMGLITGVGLVM